MRMLFVILYRSGSAEQRQLQTATHKCSQCKELDSGIETESLRKALF